MNVDLSRRVAKLMPTPIIQGLSIAEQKSLVDDVSGASNFNALNKFHQDIIIMAEGRMGAKERPRRRVKIMYDDKGGAGSGNWGHEGRPGKEGGSLPTGKSHGAIPGEGGTAGPGRFENPLRGAAQAVTKPGWNIPPPQLSIPTGPVPEHEEGDADGKADYSNWYAQQKVKPGLADALAMRKYFADRARQVESEAGAAKQKKREEDYAKRQAELKAKGPVLTPAQKKKQEAAAKKAATAAASAAKKKASEAAKVKKKAESDAAKKKKAEEAAAKKAAAAAKKAGAKKPAAKKAGDAAAKKRAAAEEAKKAKLEEKRQTTEKVAASVGMDRESLSMFQEAMTTLKGGGQLDDKVLSALRSAGLVSVSGERVAVPAAARSLLSAILAGDALKAQDAMDKLRKSSGKEYIGQVRVRKITRVVIG